ncbi:hypothetical protein BT67DRAFT_446129 [Trichocladium antarcticum]|uniref:Diaminohydroxyphosphoribosylamino-pyrimidine deaminase n=1 Tax=Trichocladium antarcticum TaxID=1450529 RepID=A0AAN6UBK9_9PEZI|nr:hypothetical protein BT67DRAFT_446129 [Trichocladium antarcticum]
MKKSESLLRALGTPVQSTEEETFELFSQDPPSQSLGFIDGKAAVLELTVGGRDFAIHQSPGVLSSNRAGGTTGAVVWKTTPPFAEWLSSPANPLFAHGVLSQDSLVLELGCGVSALVGLLVAPRIARYVLTDQPYVARLAQQNVAENQRQNQRGAASAKNPPPSRPRRASPNLAAAAGRADAARGGRIGFYPLDWETDRVTSALTGADSEAKSFDVVVACDCIYNEALVEPFVSTCVDLCRLRADATASAAPAAAAAGQATVSSDEPCICVVAQHLRDPLVFEAWLASFSDVFHTWRVPDRLLHPGLRANSGLAVHIGVLKNAIDMEGL